MPTWGDIIDEIQEEQDTRPSAFDKVRRKYLEQVASETGNDVILYSSGWTELDVNSPQFSISSTDVQGFMQTISNIGSNELDLIILC